MTNWNTKKEGVLQFFFYKKHKYYVGVCLNLDIVEYGKDPVELIRSVQEGAMTFVEGVQKKDLPDELLNKPAPKEHWDRFHKYITSLKGKSRLTEVNEKDYVALSRTPYTSKGFVAPLC